MLFYSTHSYILTHATNGDETVLKFTKKVDRLPLKWSTKYRAYCENPATDLVLATRVHRRNGPMKPPVGCSGRVEKAVQSKPEWHSEEKMGK